MKFAYSARTKKGEVKSGIVEASDKEAAFEILKRHGLYVTTLDELKIPFYARRLRIFERVGSKDIVYFSRQLAIMLKSNVPLVETFRTLASQTKNTSFKEKILKLAEEIEGGTSLSKALSLYPKIFSPFYISMVKSGEVSGKLTDVFLYLADYLEKEHNFRSKVIGAMIYPLFVLFVFVIVVTIMVVYVIPQLGMVLKETGQDLPFITEMVMSVSDFLRTRGWIIILVLIVLIIIGYRALKTKKGKRFLDNFLLKIPFLNNLLKKFYLSRFALNLSTLISGGLSIVEALGITAEVVGNSVYQDIISETKERVRRGETISSVLTKYPDIISPFFQQMILVGEKTGTLDSSLNNVVEFYQKEVERSLESFTRLLEPIFIVLLGGVVGFLMASVIIPLYSITTI